MIKNVTQIVVCVTWKDRVDIRWSSHLKRSESHLTMKMSIRVIKQLNEISLLRVWVSSSVVFVKLSLNVCFFSPIRRFSIFMGSIWPRQEAGKKKIKLYVRRIRLHPFHVYFRSKISEETEHFVKISVSEMGRTNIGDTWKGIIDKRYGLFLGFDRIINV